jgi:hypothetical protein
MRILAWRQFHVENSANQFNRLSARKQEFSRPPAKKTCFFCINPLCFFNMITSAKQILNFGVVPVLVRGAPIAVLGVLSAFAPMNAQILNPAPTAVNLLLNESGFSNEVSAAPMATVAGRARFILDSTYDTGSGPHFIGVGDWNGDGKLDLAIPNSFSNNAYTWLNLGSGIFSRNGVIAVGVLPRILTVGDFDSDGDLDLAVLNESSYSVSILNNDGQGNFVARSSTISTESEPSHITSGDINRDGFLDLVVARYASSSILVLINGGDGNFNTQIPYSLNQRPIDSFLGDFDNDGFLDLVVTNLDNNTVSLLVNDQNGNFKAPQTFAAGIEPDFVLGQDFNLDGRLDLAVANRISNAVSILLNQGGSFSAATAYAVGSDPLAIATGDWDGDLYPDLAVVNHQSNDLYVFSNDGAGRFQIDTIYTTGVRPRFVTSGDFDGDGAPDLAVANWGANNFQIFSNQRLPMQNRAPGAPQLFLPNNRAFVNPNLAELRLSWSVPLDQDHDALHFLIEIDQSPDFASPDLRFESKDAATGFFPVPPVDQDIDTVSFKLVASLASGLYWWRVTAWDGAVYGQPSQPKNFVVDTTPPILVGLILTNPVFPPNWYNPINISSIDFGVQYDESYAQQAEFDLGAFGGMQLVKNIPSGSNQIVTVPVKLAGAADGPYRLTVVLYDSAGNISKDSTAIALDSSPPTGALASSPDTSAKEKFVVSWGGTATDGAGSGISGKYDVRVQIDGGAWKDWLTNFAGNSAEYQGTHGHTHGFEAAARDNVGNIEAFAQIPETVTVVDTTANDKNAPGPPQRLTAGGSNPSPWQQNPVFQIAWQAPSDPSGIGKALYKLGNSPTANFDTTGSVLAGSSLQITATQEEGQNLYLWFVDRRGNVDFRNHGVVTLRYDRTLPEIKSFDILNADFQPYWYNQGKPDPAQIRINYSERHPQRLRVASEPLNLNVEVAQLPGGDAAAYLFNAVIQGKPDGVYYLEFTLTDSAGNLARDTTAIGLDNTPPAGARASSPDTSKGERFSVSWGGTATDGAGSGISGKYDVRVRIDGGNWQAWLTNFTGNSAEYEGLHGREYGFEAAARDNVGNIEAFAQIAETVTVVDTSVADRTPPFIFHSAISVVEEGENADIQVQIQDAVRVDAAHLFYKQSGKRSYQTMPMTALGGGIYRATLSAATISTKGVNYYIQASDGLNFSHHPLENWDTVPHNISVRIRGANNQGLTKEEPQPGGNAQSAFRMISLPLVLEDSRPQAVFEDDLGPYDPKQWRLFRFNPLAGDYSEFPDLESFSPGKAFWLIVRPPNKQIDSGIGTTVATNQPFQIALQQGWNDIANPFTFPVNWSDVQIIQGNPAEIMGPYTYRGQWLLPDQVTTLSPWEGYAVYSLMPSAIIATPPIEAVATPGKTLSKHDGKTDWRLGCIAVCEQASDGANYLGVSSAASAGWDKLDYLEPPPIGEYVLLRFPHHEWPTYRGAFSTDFRPPFADGQVWHFEVATNISNAPITLKFQHVESLPAGFQAVLRDLTTLAQIDIQQSPEYVFVPDQSRLSGEFELVVGTAAYIENSDRQKQAAPKTFSLGQNFPNPFNAGTTMLYQVAEPGHVSIKVFNIHGQEIRRLMAQPQNPGRYQIRWDAKSDDQREMGSGIYFIQLEAGHFRQIRKVLLVR